MGPTFIGADLGDGVIVERIDTEHDHYRQGIKVHVELLLTGLNPDVQEMMRKLGDLFSVGLQPSDAGAPSNGGRPDTSTLQEEQEEDFETMVARRFDDIDQALRLLVDP